MKEDVDQSEKWVIHGTRVPSTRYARRSPTFTKCIMCGHVTIVGFDRVPAYWVRILACVVVVPAVSTTAFQMLVMDTAPDGQSHSTTVFAAPLP